MAIKQLTRIFKLKEITLEDPNTSWSEKQVKDFYANQYPELINANISNPQYINDQIIFEFETNLGTKG